MRIRYALVAVASAAALAVSPSQAAESSFPDKPIRLVIGSAPGSTRALPTSFITQNTSSSP